MTVPSPRPFTVPNAMNEMSAAVQQSEESKQIFMVPNLVPAFLARSLTTASAGWSRVLAESIMQTPRARTAHPRTSVRTLSG